MGKIDRVERRANIIVAVCAKGVHPDSDTKNYMAGYSALFRMFREYVCLNDPETVVAGILAIYGWMPTIPKSPSPDTIRKFFLVFSALPETGSVGKVLRALPEKDRRILLQSFNDSVVGTSKVLHFLRPDQFPIWDANVAANFDLRWHYSINDPGAYVDYVQAMEQCLTDPERKRALESRLGANPSLRDIELVLFQAGKANRSR